ncbi:MAG TPA: serine hydrolase [Bacteroidota bacterium]|nr:serine hydrolase [Bacteroidota bacterium]
MILGTVLAGSLHLGPFPLRAQPSADRTLQQEIEKACRDFKGVAGIYVRNLRSGRWAAFNADSLFPTASMVKVPILCGLFDKVIKGEIGYEDAIVYRDSMKYDNGITGSFRDSTRIPVRELAHLMISVSDNTASLWLQALAGTGTSINQWLEVNGFRHTRVNSRTPGREEMRSVYGWGVTTPREMAELLVLIRAGKAVSPAASEEMYRILGKSYWDKEALSQVPPYIQAISKQGAVNASRSEVVLANAPSGDYVFCVITKNQEDQSWKRDNEGSGIFRGSFGSTLSRRRTGLRLKSGSRIPTSND